MMKRKSLCRSKLLFARCCLECTAKTCHVLTHMVYTEYCTARHGNKYKPTAILDPFQNMRCSQNAKSNSHSFSQMLSSLSFSSKTNIAIFVSDSDVILNTKLSKLPSSDLNKPQPSPELEGRHVTILLALCDNFKIYAHFLPRCKSHELIPAGCIQDDWRPNMSFVSNWT